MENLPGIYRFPSRFTSVFGWNPSWTPRKKVAVSSFHAQTEGKEPPHKENKKRFEPHIKGENL